MLFVDALFRFSGVGLLLLLAMLAWRGQREWKSAPYLILSCLSVSALFLGYAPPILRPPEPLLTIVRLADIPHLIFVWLFALSLFEDDFRLRTHHVVIGVLYSAPILWLRLYDIGLIDPPPVIMVPIGSATSIALIAHLIWSTLQGRKDDLLERRRAVRVYFILTISAVAVAAALSDLLPPEGPFDRRTAKVLAIWPAIAFGTLWMLAFNGNAVRFGAAGEPSSSLGPKDQSLWDRLTSKMEAEELYRDAELSIVALSSQLGVSQHRLRSLINAKLGFANFSAFINGYRIEAVERALRDPAKAETPILTLAYDAGFKSLSPFNKAFKDVTGTTPSEYRKSVLSECSKREIR